MMKPSRIRESQKHEEDRYEMNSRLENQDLDVIQDEQSTSDHEQAVFTTPIFKNQKEEWFVNAPP